MGGGEGMGGERGGGRGEYGYFQELHIKQVQIEANQSGKYNSYFLLSTEAVLKNIHQLQLITRKKCNNFSKIVPPKLKARVVTFNPLLKTVFNK